MNKWADKDPDETLDYQIDWSARIPAGDSIATSAWTVPSGLTGGTESVSVKSTTIWLSGGTANTDYSVTNRVTTTAGRIMDQSVPLRCRNK